MSLQYIIDGYNITNHPRFPERYKNRNAPAESLAGFIRDNDLTGSSKNKLIIVFDGYPPAGSCYDSGTIVFSRKISADEKIKKLIEERSGRKNIIIVSDDRQIKSAAGSLGARCMSVGDFIGSKTASARSRGKEAAAFELTYTQIHDINEELKKIWLR